LLLLVCASTNQYLDKDRCPYDVTHKERGGGFAKGSRKFVVREIPSDARVKGAKPTNHVEKRVTGFERWGGLVNPERLGELKFRKRGTIVHAGGELKGACVLLMMVTIAIDIEKKPL